MAIKFPVISWPWRKVLQAEVVPPPTLEEQLEARRKRFADSVRNAISQARTEISTTGSPVPMRLPPTPYIPPRGVLPANFKPAMGMDAAWTNMASDDSFVLNSVNGITANVLDGMGFPGFPFLTELTQLTEYRDMSERTAAEMTRKWIKLRNTGTEDRTEIISRIEDALKKHHVRDLFQQAAILDGFMGRCQLFVNLGDIEGHELETPLMLNRYKIKRGDLRGFKIIEPITTYPANYNASNPLASDYYKPSAWFVYGQKVHSSRLMNFVSRPLPDLLKPVYNFSGMSLSQLAQPYVDYWLGTRDSVGKLLRNFSTTVLQTNLDTLLSPNGQELINRITLFTKNRDNQGVFMVNKGQEDLVQLNVPLAGLADLQAQAQEHMAAVAKTPLVILLGITPKGLNASAEGDIRIYYDYIADQQEKLFRTPLETVVKIIQLDLFGEIYSDITFDFEALYEMSEKERALIQKSIADAAVELVQVGAIRPEEVRDRLANDPESGYNSLDADDVPEPPAFGTPPNPTDPTLQVAAEQPDPASQAAGDIAVRIMGDVNRMAHDGGFRGNQHIGGITEKDGPVAVAMKLSAAATAASREARRAGTKRAHQKALAAHEKAWAAHNRVVSSDDSANKDVHEAYSGAHIASMGAHKLMS